MGNFRQFFSISNHKANTTELHPKVRKTCLITIAYEGIRISVRLLPCCSNTAELNIITQLCHAAAGRGGDGDGDEASIVRLCHATVSCQASVRAW